MVVDTDIVTAVGVTGEYRDYLSTRRLDRPVQIPKQPTSKDTTGVSQGVYRRYAVLSAYLTEGT